MEIAKFETTKLLITKSLMVTKLNNLPYLKGTCDHLRKNMTVAGLALWEVLKGKKLCGRNSGVNIALDFILQASIALLKN